MTDSKKIIDQVTKAIAMTSSPYAEEARTAAWIAVRLIADHKLSIGNDSHERVRSNAYQQGFDDGKKSGFSSGYDAGYKEGSRVQKPPPPAAGRRSTPMTRWLMIESRYDATCANCGDPVMAGEKVWWRKGDRARCEECGPGE